MQRGAGTWRVQRTRGLRRPATGTTLTAEFRTKIHVETTPCCPRRTPRTLAVSAVTNIAQTYLIDSHKRYATTQIHCYLRTCSIISDLIKRCIISKNYSHTTLLCVHTQLEMDIKCVVPATRRLEVVNLKCRNIYRQSRWRSVYRCQVFFVDLKNRR